MGEERKKARCPKGMFCGQGLLLLAFVLAIFLATPVLAAEQKYGLDLEWRPIPGVGEPPARHDKPADKPGEKEARRDVAHTVKTFQVKGVTFKMIRIPAGEFMMGSAADEPGRDSDETQHQVKVSRDYWLGETEVTQGLWKAVMGDNPSSFKDCGDDCPVENVSWNDCQKFIQRLNVLVSGGGFRLPTESEREYGCRSGGKAELYCGGNDLDALGWYDKNSGGRTHPVKQKKANGLALYDMSGNVWEWCEDWKGDYPSGTVTDPAGPSSGSDRVLRGGSWGDNAGNCRSANRNWLGPGSRNFGSGFRLAGS